MHSRKRSTGEPYLSTSSTRNPNQTLSRRSSSSILKKTSVSSSSTNSAMVMPLLQTRKSKPKGKSCHVEIIQEVDDEPITNTEKVIRRRRKLVENDYDDNDEDDQNHNFIEPFDEAVSKEIALAVALIVAEYEMMRQKERAHKKATSRSSNIISQENESEEVVMGENTVMPSVSTVSSAVSQLQFDPVELEESMHNGLTVVGSGKASKSRSQNSVWKTPPTPSKGVKMGGNVEVNRYLTRVQNFMNSLGYHREGEPEIKINVRLSMKMQMITAKELIRSAMPIKCLHAVVLAVYLTNCIDTVERFPIYFRSHVLGKEYKHIVLGIYVQGHFGALGISRDQGLQDKSTIYTKLSDLIFEFAKCYEESGHTLNEVKFGQIITHDQNSLERLFSKIGLIPISGCSHAEIEANVERFSKQLRAKMGTACLKSQQSPAQLTRISRSRTSMHNTSGNNPTANNNNNNSAQGSSSRPRAMSIGPIPSASRRTSEERLGKGGVKSKPPKSMKR